MPLSQLLGSSMVAVGLFGFAVAVIWVYSLQGGATPRWFSQTVAYLGTKQQWLLATTLALGNLIAVAAGLAILWIPDAGRVVDRLFTR